MTVDMKFDINSLTEVVGINAALMEIYDQAKYNTTDRVSRYLYDFDNNGKRYVTIQNLLEHNSGTLLLTI
jgi:CubicO group peptidase (beta-lactamase class C family)